MALFQIAHSAASQRQTEQIPVWANPDPGAIPYPNPDFVLTLAPTPAQPRPLPNPDPAVCCARLCGLHSEAFMSAQVGLIATRNFHLYAGGALTCDPVTESDALAVRTRKCAATSSDCRSPCSL